MFNNFSEKEESENQMKSLHELKNKMIIFLEQSNLIRKKLESEIVTLRLQVKEHQTENDKLKTEIKSLKIKSRSNSSKPKRFFIKIRKSNNKSIIKKQTPQINQLKSMKIGSSFVLQNKVKNEDFETEKKTRNYNRIYCETTEQKKSEKNEENLNKAGNLQINHVFRIKKRTKSDAFLNLQQINPMVEIYYENSSSEREFHLGNEKSSCYYKSSVNHQGWKKVARNVRNPNKKPKKIILLKLKRIKKFYN